MKDVGELSYFLGIEVCRNSYGIFISQNKFTLDLLKDHKMQHVKPLKLPLDTHIKFSHDPGQFQYLIGKLI